MTYLDWVRVVAIVLSVGVLVWPGWSHASTMMRLELGKLVWPEIRLRLARERPFATSGLSHRMRWFESAAEPETTADATEDLLYGASAQRSAAAVDSRLRRLETVLPEEIERAQASLSRASATWPLTDDYLRAARRVWRVSSTRAVIRTVWISAPLVFRSVRGASENVRRLATLGRLSLLAVVAGMAPEIRVGWGAALQQLSLIVTIAQLALAWWLFGKLLGTHTPTRRAFRYALRLVGPIAMLTAAVLVVVPWSELAQQQPGSSEQSISAGSGDDAMHPGFAVVGALLVAALTCVAMRLIPRARYRKRVFAWACQAFAAGMGLGLVLVAVSELVGHGEPHALQSVALWVLGGSTGVALLLAAAGYIAIEFEGRLDRRLAAQSGLPFTWYPTAPVAAAGFFLVGSVGGVVSLAAGRSAVTAGVAVGELAMAPLFLVSLGVCMSCSWLGRQVQRQRDEQRLELHDAMVNPAA